jgi:hypothetical protein
LFCRLVINFTEFGVFDLRNRLAQAITEIGAMLLGSVIGSVTTLFHHCNHAFERLQGANVFCNAHALAHRIAGSNPSPAVLTAAGRIRTWTTSICVPRAVNSSRRV